MSVIDINRKKNGKNSMMLTDFSLHNIINNCVLKTLHTLTHCFIWCVNCYIIHFFSYYSENA